MKQTTVRIDSDLAETLLILKKELKLFTASDVVRHLIKEYRETHGWSTLSIAHELTIMEVQGGEKTNSKV